LLMHPFKLNFSTPAVFGSHAVKLYAYNKRKAKYEICEITLLIVFVEQDSGGAVNLIHLVRRPTND